MLSTLIIRLNLFLLDVKKTLGKTNFVKTKRTLEHVFHDLFKYVTYKTHHRKTFPRQNYNAGNNSWLY